MQIIEFNVCLRIWKMENHHLNVLGKILWGGEVRSGKECWTSKPKMMGHVPLRPLAVVPVHGHQRSANEWCWS